MKDKPIILVVDDQPQNIELLEAYLVQQGYETVTATNGEEALVKLFENPIDLILLDVMMPGIDGFEVTRRVRQDDIHRLLPIILLSSLREKEDRVKGIEAGCDDFISKPIDKMELLARVRSLLKVKAYNDLMSNYREELEHEINRRTGELKHVLKDLQQEIIERKQAAEALRESAEKYQRFFMTSRDCVFITSKDGDWIDMNDAAVELFGYSSREELMRMNIRNLYANPEERTRHGNIIAELGYCKEFPVDLHRKDGMVINTLITSVALYDTEKNVIGFQGTIRDITKRKQSEEQILIFRYFVEASGQGLGMATFDGSMTYINPTLCRFLGEEKAEEVYKKKFALYYPQEMRELLEKEVLPAVMSKGQWIGELALISVHGKYTPTIENFFLIRDKEGNPLCLADVITDITDLKRAEEELKRTAEKLRRSLVGTIQAMSIIEETRDPYTAGHQRRVSNLARIIAQEMALPNDTVDTIRMAGIIHDIGKMSVPAEILSKPGKLTDIEMSLIKVHAQSGYDILKDVELPYPIAEIVLQHHERIDGSGYPNGLKGDRILIEARIIAVADVVEAISSHRPYRPAKGIDVALEEIENNAGLLYDREVARICLKLFREEGFRFE